MKYCRGDRVIIEGNLMGTIVEEWIHSNGVPFYKIYVDEFRALKDYDEDLVQRCLVRHKYLSDEEMEWQSNAVNGV